MDIGAQAAILEIDLDKLRAFGRREHYAACRRLRFSSLFRSASRGVCEPSCGAGVHDVGSARRCRPVAQLVRAHA